MRRRSPLLAGLVATGALLASGIGTPARAQAGVFLSEGEAVQEVFPDAALVAKRDWTPSPAERSSMEERLGRQLEDSGYPVILVYDADQIFLGYGLVTEERGKYRPITFLVGVTPGGKVKDTAVMVYREDRGGEVRTRRFLRQYRGKAADDPIRADRDIVNISGATISVYSMNAGVRKALAIVATAFPDGPPSIAPDALRPLDSLR